MGKVRRAIPGDTPALIEMGRALHAESPRYRGMPFSAAKLERLAVRLQGTLIAEDAVVLVAEEAGEPVGIAVGILADRWFNDEKFATDLTMYLKPEHRGGRLFLKLATALETWARQQGVPDIAIGVSTEVHPERTVRAYERLGYTLTGYTLTKRLTDGN